MDDITLTVGRPRLGGPTLPGLLEATEARLRAENSPSLLVTPPYGRALAFDDLRAERAAWTCQIDADDLDLLTVQLHGLVAGARFGLTISNTSGAVITSDFEPDGRADLLVGPLGLRRSDLCQVEIVRVGSHHDDVLRGDALVTFVQVIGYSAEIDQVVV